MSWDGQAAENRSRPKRAEQARPGWAENGPNRFERRASRDIVRRAVALRYNAGEEVSPTVVGKGSGELAERIIALAREHGVHVHEDRDLVALLSQLDLGASIPPELYRAVAAVLAFVYKLHGRLP